ncbi:hypothetical protein PV327_007199 [Microctonus hyperodae]|uniref:Uncharacterized protein n=1 Tax=Microctonus hyperodae TaxID=165561 RepID=A0AA39KJE1_MICHY|nr:hypothetical protein PV327_007199 [Microctonus hyperodae]
MVVTWTWPRSTPGESRERDAHHIEAKEDGEIKDEEEEEKLRMSTELKKMKGGKRGGLRIAYTAPLNTIISKTIYDEEDGNEGGVARKNVIAWVNYVAGELECYRENEGKKNHTVLPIVMDYYEVSMYDILDDSFMYIIKHHYQLDTCR